MSRVFLYNDARYHLGLLVPQRAGLTEICDLGPDDQAEIVSLSKFIRALPGVEKLNVGYLGIAVPQLHVHVVGRFKGDPACPVRSGATARPSHGHLLRKPPSAAQWPPPVARINKLCAARQRSGITGQAVAKLVQTLQLAGC